MIALHAPLIVVGQVYLNGPLNEYMIVTRNNRGQISFAGRGFNGQAEDQVFIESFEPVNPQDVDSTELEFLTSLCPSGTRPSIGYIQED